MASRALTARLMITCSNWWMSTSTKPRSRSCEILSSTFSPSTRPSRLPRSESASVSTCTLGCSVCLREKARSWRTRLAARLAFCLMFMTSAKAGSVGPHLGQQQIGEADDRGQHVVEVMRDAGGELAHRQKLLALRELHLERLVLGLVHGEDHGGVVLRGQPGEGEEHVARALALHIGLDLVQASFGGEGGGQRLLQGGALGCDDGGGELRTAPHLRRQVDEGGIGHADAALLVDLGDADRRIVDEAGQARGGNLRPAAPPPP